jgi:phage tail protein X
MKTYIAANGDTWDSIAFKVYGDEFLCDQLCAANAHDHDGVVMFEGGERIIIPESVASQVNVIKAPWE